MQSLFASDQSLYSDLEQFVEPLITTTQLELLTSDIEAAKFHVAPSRASVDAAGTCNRLDDDLAAFEDIITDGLLFQSTQIPPEITDGPLHSGLYYTPLLWEHPQLDYQIGSPNSYAPLNIAGEAKLRSIASPEQPHPVDPASSPLPEPRGTDNRRKRKPLESSEPDFLPQQRGRPSNHKKTAHNIIEKRYRTNINDKITALCNSVPSLHKNNSNSENLQEDFRGLSPLPKHNKVYTLVPCLSSSFSLLPFPSIASIYGN